MERLKNLKRENARLAELSLENMETIRELREDKSFLKKHYKARTRRIQEIKKKLEKERKLREKEREKVERESELRAKETEKVERERKYTKQARDQNEQVIKERDEIKTE